MLHHPDAVLLGFPLAGEWMALRTPAHRVPTHGTDFLGQRFAYDFVRQTRSRWAPFGPPAVAHSLVRVPVTSFAGWNAPVLAADAGQVLQASDGWPDRSWLNIWWDLGRLRLTHRVRPPRITRTDWRPLAGNYLLIEGAAGVTFYAHLRCGSLRPRPGDRVAAGDPLGAVGHSGRSGIPHLHFHLMDRPDGLAAAGRLCGFRAFDRWDGGSWQPASGIPGLRERIRGAS
jgi:Peptidase family M23